MDISVKPGTYVVAVSGGVDSMVLLRMLVEKAQDLARDKPDVKLIVAHFDHGIRSDSVLDRKLVHAAAREYGLQFVYDEGKLGVDASEEQARKARYAFLRRVQHAAEADAIITAHHWDDALETAIINMIRGTNRRGLSALRSKQGLLRPFVDSEITKNQIKAYAQQQNIAWNEDSTNMDIKYLRNYVRTVLLPRFDTAARQKMEDIVRRIGPLNDQIDQHIAALLTAQPEPGQIDRQQFIQLPHAIAREVLAAWLRINGSSKVDAYTIERLVIVP